MGCLLRTLYKIADDCSFFSPFKMVRISLQFKANLENITNIKPDGDDFRWYLKLKCLNCGEVTKQWIYLCAMESVAIKGSRGSANYVSKCKLCGRENSLDIIKDSIKEYTAEDSNNFKTMVTFDCRGLEPIDFSPRTGFVAEGVETSTKFIDIDLSEADWSDYDEKAQQSVGVFEVTSQFIKAA